MISAYTATTRIEGFANSFGDSGASATSILTAQNYGAGKKNRVRETFMTSRILLLLLGVICAVIMFIFAPGLSGFMLGTYTGAAYENTASYLRTVALFYVLCFTGNTFAGYFDGIGKVTIPMAGAIGHIAIRVVFSRLWIGSMGLPAVAAATGIGWGCANVFWEILYQKTRRAE
jgi:Na+-driven multidrug efflux pump